MPDIVHLTTLHPRTDVRIFKKEAMTLARELGSDVAALVADGKGNAAAGADSPRIHDLGALGTGRLGRFVRGSLRAIGAVRRLKPRIVHFHDPELIPAALALKLLGFKIVYDVHEDVPRQILSKHWIPALVRRPISFVAEGAERLAMLVFDGFVTATSTIAARFPAERTVVVQNFPICDELLLPSAMPYAERPPAFAYIGGLSPVRGIEEMMRALERIAADRDVSLDLAGLFESPALQARVEELPAWRRVTYHGYASRAEIAGILGRSRAGLVLLHPIENYLEAWPVKLFEYMAAGLPVIVSDFPLWRRIVEGAACGLVVDPKDITAIAAAMRALIDDPAEAEAMGRRGREAVEHIYNWEAEGRRLATFYRERLTPGRPGHAVSSAA